MILATDEMGKLLGLTPRRINQLAAECLFVRHDGGGFDAPASIQRYIEHVSGKGRSKDAALDSEREGARLKKEQADAAAMKNARERREVISAFEAEHAWSEQIARLRSGLLAVPSRVRQRTSISVEDGIVLDREIRDAMISLAEVRFSDDTATDGDSDGASAPEPAEEDQPS